MAKWNHYELVVDGEAVIDFMIDGEAEAVIGGGGAGYPAYTGPTEFTPSQNMQYAPTSGKTVLTNIIVNPIPSNYGLITWDGTKLTVS